MAMNPIIQAIAGKSSMSQARQMIQALKASNNPQAMITQIMSSNPKIRQIIDQYGGDPQTAFYRYAEANGVNPDEILNMMR